ncbi:hypothetical protein ACFL2X_03740 [Candidatus Latescibacterota bacterium]
MILNYPDDYKNWKKLAKHCNELNGLSDFEKVKCERAFQFLKEEFGESFLEDAFKEHHPFVEYISNTAPWTRKWIIWFTEAIKESKFHNNYQSLLNRLIKADTFAEGFSVLEIAFKFTKIGYLITFDPSISVSGRNKKPDIKLIDKDNEEELYIEVSLQNESVKSKQISKTMEAIHEPLWKHVPYLNYSGRIYKSLSDIHLRDIVKKIELATTKTIEENAFNEVSVNGIIDIGIAPINEKETLKLWAKEKNLKDGEFIGPSYDVDEIIRTKIKIKKEQAQLPDKYPGIIVIKNSNLFLYERDIRKVISELEEEVYKYNHILAVVISGGYGGISENTFIMKDQHVFMKKSKFDLFTEDHIILLNQFCNLRILPSSITKMYNAFKNY